MYISRIDSVDMMYTYNMIEKSYIFLRGYPRIEGSSDKVVVKLAGSIAGIGSQRF